MQVKVNAVKYTGDGRRNIITKQLKDSSLGFQEGKLKYLQNHLLFQHVLYSINWRIGGYMYRGITEDTPFARS